jgi:hypothetical protein
MNPVSGTVRIYRAPIIPIVIQKLVKRQEMRRRRNAITAGMKRLLIRTDLSDIVGSLDAIRDPTKRSMKTPVQGF